MIDETLKWMARVAIADGHLDETEKGVLQVYAVERGLSPEEFARFIDRLKREASVRTRTVTPIKPEVLKGILFESAASRMIQGVEGLTVISRSADYKLGWTGAPLDERSKQPDFFVKVKFGPFFVRFYIECKFRSSGRLELNERQIRKYMDAGNKEECPVFFLMGAGPDPSHPEAVFFFSVGDVVCGHAATVDSRKRYTVTAATADAFRVSADSIKRVLLRRLIRGNEDFLKNML